jgi:hypothetical protein
VNHLEPPAGRWYDFRGMATYRIEFTQEARNDLAYFSVHEQKRSVDEVKL